MSRRSSRIRSRRSREEERSRGGWDSPRDRRGGMLSSPRRLPSNPSPRPPNSPTPRPRAHARARTPHARASLQHVSARPGRRNKCDIGRGGQGVLQEVQGVVGRPQTPLDGQVRPPTLRL